MGSKNLKAIVVEGREKNKAADQDQFKFLLYETGKLLKASPLTSQALPEFGTAVVMNVINEIGALPTRNFQQSQFEGADKISGEAITKNNLVKNQACWACPITCTRITKTESGKEGEGEGRSGRIRHVADSGQGFCQDGDFPGPVEGFDEIGKQQPGGYEEDEPQQRPHELLPEHHEELRCDFHV